MPKPQDVTEQILNHMADTVVSASAGTGKTYILVKKFLHLLSQTNKDGEYQKLGGILAITFTDKAAEEMKTRISKELTQEINRLTKLAEKDGNKKAKELAKHLLESRRRLSQAFISTIHSFCARLLRENPVEAGIDPHFEILEEQKANIMQATALERFLLSKLRLRDQQVADLAYRYGFDSKFKRASPLSSIIAMLLPLTRAAGAIRKDSLLKSYRKLKRESANQLTNLQADMPIAIANLLPHMNTKNRQETLAAIEKAVENLKGGADTGKLAVVQMLEKWTDKDSDGLGLRINAEKQPEVKEAERHLRALLDHYNGTLISLLAMPAAEAMVELLEQFQQHMEQRVKGRLYLDFDDLQERTLYLLGRNKQLLERYRTLFSHILVDEFQDVNGLQKKILDKLAKVGDGKLFIVGDVKQAIYGFRGGDLEVFKNMESEIANSGSKPFYLQTNRRSSPQLVEFINGFFGTHLPEIFSKSDHCSAKRKPSREKPVQLITIIGQENIALLRQREAEELSIRIQQIIDSKQQIEDENGKLRDAQYGDMAILFRTFSSLTIYEAAIQEAKIPYQITKGSGFYQRQEVADMISALSFIDNSGDSAAFIGLLRSPIVGISDGSVLTIRREGTDDYNHPLKSILTPLKKGLLPEDEQQRFNLFRNWVKPLLDLKERMSISEIMESIISNSGIAGILGAQPSGTQKAANVLKLMEQSRLMEQTEGSSLKNFVRYLAELQATKENEPQAVVATADNNAINIMTMHASKGLEFPIVLLPDITSKGMANKRPVIFSKNHGIATKYKDKEVMKARKGILFSQIEEETKAKEAEDAMRVFYVACTRARDRLILSANVKDIDKISGLLPQLLSFKEKRPELFLENAEAEKAESSSKEKTAYEEILNSKEWQKPMPQREEKKPMPPYSGYLPVTQIAGYRRCQREYLLSGIYKVPPPTKNSDGKKSSSSDNIKNGGYSGIEVGEAVHSTLERLNLALPQAEFMAGAENLLAERLPRLTTKERSQIAMRLDKLWNEEPFKELRSGELTEFGREVSFIHKIKTDNGIAHIKGQIDLLLRQDDMPVVVDYKYSAGAKEDSRYIHQLEIYAIAAEAMVGRGNVAAVRCILAYAGSDKPKVKSWIMDATRLMEARQELADSIAQMAKLEQLSRKSGGIKAADVLPNGGHCPDKRCAYWKVCGRMLA